jgi:hypothetical protein
LKTFLVWIPAIIIYGLFLGWHQNWGGPLRAVEISNIMQRLEASEVGASGRNEIETMRKFLEADDGREFYMLNLVRVDPGEVKGPDGVVRPAREVIEGYTKMFMPSLLASSARAATRSSMRNRATLHDTMTKKAMDTSSSVSASLLA